MPGRRSVRSKETCALYIKKVLKQIHPDLTISPAARRMVNLFLEDMMWRISTEAGQHARSDRRAVMRTHDVQVALVRVLPPKMKALAKCNADFCVFKYVDSQ